jgi:plastocyanin
MKRLVSLALVCLVVISSVPSLRAHAATARSRAHTAAVPEQTVLVGQGELDVSQGSLLSNTPRYIDITVGDSVLFRDVDALEPHTVSFGPMAMLKDLAGKDQFIAIPQKSGPPVLALNPKVAFPTPHAPYDGTGYANSGLMMKGQSWSLTFSKAGTFQYICLIHGTIMNGYVIVHAATPPGALTFVQAGDGLKAVRDQTNNTVNDAFYPHQLTIHVGNTVEWIGGFHTITFGPAAMIKQLEKSLFVPVPRKSGPPLLEFNPKVAFPSGGSTYDGTGFVNSGVLPLNMPPNSKAPPSFKLTFTKAGTYTYYCLLHPGMDGTITVAP